jgi:hypothetical protein
MRCELAFPFLVVSGEWFRGEFHVAFCKARGLEVSMIGLESSLLELFQYKWHQFGLELGFLNFSRAKWARSCLKLASIRVSSGFF